MKYSLENFNDLYNNTYNMISKFVVCKCSNIDDVNDIIQNIYLEVIKILKKEDRELTDSYLIGIADHKVKDYYRFKYKNKILSFFSNDDYDELENIKDDINIEESIILKYDTEEVWNLLKKKNPIISKIFYLYYYLGLTIKDISTELNISESSVKNYLYRTIKELNKKYEYN